MRRKILIVLAVVAVLFCGARQANADSTIGIADTFNCYPFTCSDSTTSVGQSIEYQQVYDATALAGITSFNTLTFYDTFTTLSGLTGGPILTGDYAIQFFYTAAAVNGLGATATSNEGALIGAFSSFTVSSPLAVNGSISFAGNTLNYDPTSGNLLMDVIALNQPMVPNGSGGYLDAQYAGPSSSRFYDVTGGLTGADSLGLVTGFSTVAAPEPSSLLLLSTGLLFGLGLMLWRR
jgi:hypothetical protein